MLYWFCPATLRNRLLEVALLDLCFRPPAAARLLLLLPNWEEKLLRLLSARKTTWLSATLLWISAPPCSLLLSPALLPPKKLVLFFVLLLLARNARDRLPPLSKNEPPKVLPPLRCRLKVGPEPESIEEKELLEDDTLRFRERPHFICFNSVFMLSSSSIIRC